MLLLNNDLINLSVYTESGQHLGKISDFEIESTAQNIIKYYVKPEKFIKELAGEKLIINAEQVISVSKEKMIVEDNIIKKLGEETKKAQLIKSNVATVPISNTINFTTTPLQKTRL